MHTHDFDLIMTLKAQLQQALDNEKSSSCVPSLLNLNLDSYTPHKTHLDNYQKKGTSSNNDNPNNDKSRANSSREKRQGPTEPQEKPRIVTMTLLRNRLDNDTLSSPLTYLSMHQAQLKRLGPLIGQRYGSTLQILLLHQNQLDHLHRWDWSRFTKLEYVNLALNQLTTLESLESLSCLQHSLKRLDVSCNEIPLEHLSKSVEALKSFHHLEELHLRGNPFSKHWNNSNNRHWRNYVIANLTQLNMLDGKKIQRSERIKAVQRRKMWCEELQRLLSLSSSLKKGKEMGTIAIGHDQAVEAEPVKIMALHNAPVHYQEEEGTRIPNETSNASSLSDLWLKEGDMEGFQQERHDLAVAREQERFEKWKQQQEQEYNKNNNENEEDEEDEEEEESVFIVQRNEALLKYHFKENNALSPHILTLTIFLPKHEQLPTRLIHVQVYPTNVTVVVQGKLLQLALPCTVQVDKSRVQRSGCSGNLVISMPKVHKKEDDTGLEGGYHTMEKVDSCSKSVIRSGSLGWRMCQEVIPASAALILQDVDTATTPLSSPVGKEQNLQVEKGGAESAFDEIEGQWEGDDDDESDDEPPPLC